MSTSSNPSYMLMNRNPPLPAHPQLFPQSTSRHTGPGSHLRQSSLPSTGISEENVYLYPVPENEGSGIADASADTSVEEEEEVVVHPTFGRDSALRGNVRVVVGRNEFWCHKEVLWFASPFFQGLLQGSWAENTRRSPGPTSSRRTPSPRGTDIDLTSVADSEVGPSGTTDSALDVEMGTSDTTDADTSIWESETEGASASRKGSVYLDAVSEPMGDDQMGINEIMRELREMPDVYGQSQVAAREAPPNDHTEPTLPSPQPPMTPAKIRPLRHSFSSTILSHPTRTHALPQPLRPQDDVEAVVQLHEESAAAFQDFLFWAYPHLDCKVSWTNVEPLVALSTKLLVPALQSICYHFLLSHASGKPVVALALAEEYSHGDLYREASRFVLDQPSWDKDEMQLLSPETQLKLSHRRSWFLERLLKLGSIDVKKAYQCRADCPDPTRCQALVDDKWRQANLAVCRHGPPQPSVAFRCLRQLETLPTNPSLVMPHPLCQTAARDWTKSLFDRMFQFRLINSPLSPGTEKYWLAISIN